MHESEERVSTIDLIHPADYDPRKPIFINKKSYSSDNDTDKMRGALRDEHKISQEELMKRFDTDPRTGLSDQEVLRRLEEYGDNCLDLPVINITGLYIATGVLWTALLACVILFCMYSTTVYLLGGIISFSVALLLTVNTHHVKRRNKSHLKAIEEFDALLEEQVKILRNGKVLSTLATKIVPGDIIYIYAGMKVSADIRVIESYDFKVNYCYLTGELLDLDRNASICGDDDAILADNIVLLGSECTGGAGKGVVLRTGKTTEVGKSIVKDCADA
jgi:Ca2+-transporting ATPase